MSGIELQNEKGLQRIDSAQVIQVIEVRRLGGSGVEKSPIRQIVEYWSMDGVKLAEVDSWNAVVKVETVFNVL